MCTRFVVYIKQVFTINNYLSAFRNANFKTFTGWVSHTNAIVQGFYAIDICVINKH